MSMALSFPAIGSSCTCAATSRITTYDRVICEPPQSEVQFATLEAEEVGYLEAAGVRDDESAQPELSRDRADGDEAHIGLDAERILSSLLDGTGDDAVDEKEDRSQEKQEDEDDSHEPLHGKVVHKLRRPRGDMLL